MERRTAAPPENSRSMTPGLSPPGLWSTRIASSDRMRSSSLRRKPRYDTRSTAPNNSAHSVRSKTVDPFAPRELAPGEVAPGELAPGELAPGELALDRLS